MRRASGWIAAVLLFALGGTARAGDPPRWTALERGPLAYHWNHGEGVETLLVSATAFEDRRIFRIANPAVPAEWGLWLVLSLPVPPEPLMSLPFAATLGAGIEVEGEASFREPEGPTGPAVIEGTATIVKHTPRGSGRLTARKGTARFRSAFDRGRGLVTEGEYTIHLDAPRGRPPTIEQGSLEVFESPAAPLAPTAGAVPRVEEAIRRGAAALLKVLNGPDPGAGKSALFVFALLRSGVPRSDPAVATALERLRDHLRRSGSAAVQMETYSTSLVLLAIEAQAYERFADPERGFPTYRPARLPKGEEAVIARARDLLLTAETSGAWGYGVGQFLQGHPDQSNTQFAVYALDTAARAGVTVPKEVFRHIAGIHRAGIVRGGQSVKLDIELEPLTGTAEPEPHEGSGHGGFTRPRTTPVGTSARPRAVSGELHTPARWPYFLQLPTPWMWRGDRCGLAMTLAGLSCLAIGDLGAGIAVDRDREVADGLAGVQADLATTLGAWSNGTAPTGYLLFSIEKAMDVLGIRRIGGVDWYGEGARAAIATQDRDGLFHGDDGAGPGVDTALDLLFLNRATLAPARLHLARRVETMDRRKLRRGEVEVDGDIVEPVALIHELDEPRGLAALPLLKRALSAMPPTDRPVVLSAVADVLDGASSAKVQKAARALAREMVGSDRKPGEIRVIFARWLEAAEAGDGGRWDQIASLRTLLAGEVPIVSRSAALALSRLGAIEAAPDLLDLLDGARDLEDRRFLCGCLAGLLGSEIAIDPTAPAKERKSAIAAARASFDATGPTRIRAAELRRWVGSLGCADAGLAERGRTLLLAAGGEALPALVDGLAHPQGPTAPIVSLLEEISGKRLGADVDAWRRYLAGRS